MSSPAQNQPESPPGDNVSQGANPGVGEDVGERALAIQASAEFAAYRRSWRLFVFPATVAFLLWFLLYVIMSAYARDFMAIKLFGSNINIALVFGLLQFVSTFVIAYVYARYAGRRLDPRAEALKRRIEGDTE